MHGCNHDFQYHESDSLNFPSRLTIKDPSYRDKMVRNCEKIRVSRTGVSESVRFPRILIPLVISAR